MSTSQDKITRAKTPVYENESNQGLEPTKYGMINRPEKMNTIDLCLAFLTLLLLLLEKNKNLDSFFPFLFSSTGPLVGPLPPQLLVRQ